MSDFVSRGFSGRRRAPENVARRLPPGQYAESGFPVLSAGPTPLIEREDWAKRFAAWSHKVEEYGVEDAFFDAEAAAVQGRDDPRLVRI